MSHAQWKSFLPDERRQVQLTRREIPVRLRLFHGSAALLYGGWDEEARGKEVTIQTGLPNKAVIDRVRSGL